MTRYLSAEDILVMHARIIDQVGGSHGVREQGLLVSLVHRPQATFGGKDIHSSVFDKAAALMEAIVNYHVFVDGNKRTALAAGARFLFMNGYDLAATNAAIEKMILGVAEKHIDEKVLAVWLKRNSKKLR